MDRLVSHLPLALLLVGMPAVARAQDGVPVLDRASVHVGFSLPYIDTVVRANGGLQDGTPVDLRSDLSLDDNTIVANLGATWRPFENHEFSLNYLRDDFDQRVRLSEEIVFDDVVYDVNATVDTALALDLYDLSYTWWWRNRPRWALGPRIGLVYYDYSVSVVLALDANGNEVSDGVASRFSPSMPVPSLGGAWRWTPADDWRVTVDVGILDTDINGVDASVSYARIGAQWFPRPRWGIGLRLAMETLDAEVDRERYSGDLDLDFRTGSLELIYRF